jgi:hypothetical protein
MKSRIPGTASSTIRTGRVTERRSKKEASRQKRRRWNGKIVSSYLPMPI